MITKNQLVAFAVAALFVNGVAASYLEPLELAAFFVGFALFTFNVFVIAYVMRLLFEAQGIRPNESNRVRGTGPGLALGLLKFLAVAVVLYLAIVKFSLSGLYLAIGAFFSLFLVCCAAIMQHLKRLQAK